MKSMPTTILRLACLAAALAAIGTGATAASADGAAEVCTGRAESCMTHAEFRALMIRSDALNRSYGLGRYRKYGLGTPR